MNITAPIALMIRSSPLGLDKVKRTLVFLDCPIERDTILVSKEFFFKKNGEGRVEVRGSGEGGLR